MRQTIALLINVVALSLGVAPAGSAVQSSLPPLMPMPAKVEARPGRVPIDEKTTIGLVAGVVGKDGIGGVNRMLRRLQVRTGLVMPPFMIHGRDNPTIGIHTRSDGDPPTLDTDESYSLAATDGHVRLESQTWIGTIRGLETLLQLVSGDRDGFYIPGVYIEDRPRFRWRGLLIDVGRHFEPVDVIKRQLDAMAAFKLNVLHFHLSEDQGFRVESRKFPELHKVASDGQYYTQDELRDIVAYARDRGIRVVPEFDMPGHVASWVTAYPQLGSSAGPYSLARTWGVFDPAFDPTRDETYKFIDTFIGEIAPIFPDAYWHIGGDENNGKEWKANPKIQAFMEKRKMKDPEELQTYFNQRLLPILKKHGKRMMGWDEILQPGLPKETVIHSWRGEKGLIDAAKQGYDVVLSAGYYIDLMEPASRHYAVDPLPASSPLSPAEAAHVLGGEATMWGEWVGPETIDSRIWPRTAAIAERLWSPRDVNDVNDMYRRLDAMVVHLELVGSTYERNRDVILRRLAGGRDIAAVKALADLVEPVKGYRRGQQQPWMTSLGPLSRLVDAATVDASGAREVSRLIDTVLSDVPKFVRGGNDLEVRFRGWIALKESFALTLAAAPALAETAPLVDDLAVLGRIGFEALSFLSVRATPRESWKTSAIAALDAAARPKAALEFPFLPLMRELAFAAIEQASADSMTPAEWRAKVKGLAAPPRRGRGGA